MARRKLAKGGEEMTHEIFFIQDNVKYKALVSKNELETKKIIPIDKKEDPPYLLESLFKTKEGKDYPFPRYLDPSFMKFGFYRGRF